MQNESDTDDSGSPASDDPLSEPPAGHYQESYHILNDAVNRITIGLFFLAVCIVFNYAIPLPFKIYCLLYLLPISIFISGIIKLPDSFACSKEWHDGSVRLKWVSFFFMLTSPFWYWWLAIYDNFYLLVNAIFFIMLFSLVAFNIACMVRLFAKIHEDSKLFHLSSFTRLAVVYLLFGPILALLVVCVRLMDQHSALSVIFYIRNIYVWQKLIVFSPFLLVLFCLFSLKKEVAKHCIMAE